MALHHRGSHVFTGLVDVSGATKIGIGDYALAGGTTYYVDMSSGSDGRRGTNPKDPLETITAANDLCVSARGDAIVMMTASPSSPAENETFPVAMDVRGVLLTGLYHRGGWGGGDSGFSSDVANGDTISVTTHYINIENLYLGIDSAGSTGCPITATGAYNLTVRNCQLEGQLLGLYGIEIAGDCPWLLIEDCGFGASHTTYLTTAIFITNATRSMIRRNVIYRCSSYAIHLGASCGNVSILDNRFHLSADTDGFAVYAASGSSTNFIDGNHAAHGYNDPTNDPFWDANGAGSANNWGINYKGKTAMNAAIA